MKASPLFLHTNLPPTTHQPPSGPGQRHHLATTTTKMQEEKAMFTGFGPVARKWSVCRIFEALSLPPTQAAALGAVTYQRSPRSNDRSAPAQNQGTVTYHPLLYYLYCPIFSRGT